MIEIRPVDAANGVIIAVAGALDGEDAAELGRHLQAELDRQPTVVVIDLSAVPSCVADGIDVLTVGRDRARRDGIALHLVHLGAPAARHWMAESGLT